MDGMTITQFHLAERQSGKIQNVTDTAVQERNATAWDVQGVVVALTAGIIV